MASELMSRVAFLIDADNLTPMAVEEAFEYFKKSGLVASVRRAYGGHEKLVGMKEVLKRHAIRAFVNQGKGTTDVALAVDAMDLLHTAAMPTTVAIGSSDADFAPLAVRLREAGMRVICFAQRDKSAEELPRAYDEVFDVDTPKPIEKVIPVTASQSPDPVHASRTVQNVVSAVGTVKEDVQTVRRILAVLPEWLPNTIRQLNQLGVPLRESGIKTGSKPLHELFGKHPSFFKVLPMSGPAKQVRLLKKP